MSKAIWAVIIACWVVITADRTQDWTSDLRIWAAAQRTTPQALRPRVNFAAALWRAGFRMSLTDAQLAEVASNARELDTAARIAHHNELVAGLTRQDFDAWFTGHENIAITLASSPPFSR